MKDYTKYDFAAIVGAEVSILLKSKVEYGGTLKIVSDKAIFLLMSDNPSALEGRWFAIEDIVPGSLTAKIKVEDMTIKQLRSQEKYKYFLCSSNFAQEALAHGNIDVFNGYIDCTDWGWKHE